MKLDPRIKSLSDVLTPFDMERAKEFIGQKGYFAADLECFESLGGCADGDLVNVSENLLNHYYSPYLTEDKSFPYFIPESSLKPEWEKYRPYTPEEFCDKFDIDQEIIFRKQGEEGNGEDLIVQGLWHRQCNGKTIIYAIMGFHLYTLDELFNNYEWRGAHRKDFVPFGVGVEE